MHVEQAIRLRRSVKPEHMSPDPVPREVIRELLEGANWAPSHGLTEPWRFQVYEGDARLRLGEAILSTMEQDGRPITEDDPRRIKLMTKLGTAPVCIAIVCAPSEAPQIFEHEEIAAVAMAVQNLTLLARARGLATFWSSGKKAFHPNVAAFLGLQGRERCLGFLYLGRPAHDFPTGERRPIEDKVKWIDT